jgi:hypothetical protein
MNKAERDAIRARCKSKTLGPWDFVTHARQDLPALLEALEEMEKDRDKWKSRAEALERAIKDWDVNVDLMSPACATCKNRNANADCSATCGNDFKNWQLHARFTDVAVKEESGDNK